jgi:hypothetical protein
MIVADTTKVETLFMSTFGNLSVGGGGPETDTNTQTETDTDTPTVSSSTEGDDVFKNMGTECTVSACKKTRVDSIK